MHTYTHPFSPTNTNTHTLLLYGLSLVVMEDLSLGGFTKLHDIVIFGDVSCHLAAIEGALKFIGRVHKETWLEEMNSDEKDAIRSNHR